MARIEEVEDLADLALTAPTAMKTGAVPLEEEVASVVAAAAEVAGGHPTVAMAVVPRLMIKDLRKGTREATITTTQEAARKITIIRTPAMVSSTPLQTGGPITTRVTEETTKVR